MIGTHVGAVDVISGSSSEADDETVIAAMEKSDICLIICDCGLRASITLIGCTFMTPCDLAVGVLETSGELREVWGITGVCVGVL